MPPEKSNAAEARHITPAPPIEEARPSLTKEDLASVRRIQGEIRGALPQLPGNIVAEVTNLLATVEGHLAAEPPNPVATGEALALIRDQLESAQDSALARQLAEKTKPVLQRLGELV
jgi:hypothetical protein